MTHFPQILTGMTAMNTAATYGILTEVANDDIPTPNPEPAKPACVEFEVGVVYTGTFVTNADSKFAYKIVRRTAKSVWVQQVCPTTHTPRGDVERKAVKGHHTGAYELIYPMGRYSMCPILGADRKA